METSNGGTLPGDFVCHNLETTIANCHNPYPQLNNNLNSNSYLTSSTWGSAEDTLLLVMDEKCKSSLSKAHLHTYCIL